MKTLWDVTVAMKTPTAWKKHSVMGKYRTKTNETNNNYLEEKKWEPKFLNENTIIIVWAKLGYKQTRNTKKNDNIETIFGQNS